MDNSQGGHAFNVDGYRDSDSKYHVNFGWSGDGNSWYAMNSFTYSGMTFSSSQQAVIGIQSPGGIVATPELTVDPTSLTFTGNVGETYTKTFTVTGTDLQGDVTITKTSGNFFSVSPTTITAAQAAAGATVTVTYAPTSAGAQTGSITISSTNAESQTVSLSGTSTNVPRLAVDPAALTFSTEAGQTVTQTFNLSGSNLTSGSMITLAVSGDNASFFTLDKTSVTRTAVQNGTTITVTYKPTAGGTHNAVVTISGGGAESKTVTLTGTATEPERTITVNPTSLSFSGVTGQTYTKTFTVTGTNLNGNLTLTLNNANGIYTISRTSITASQAASGVSVTVTYKPTVAGTTNASVTISGGGADDKTVTLTGTAVGPTITANPTALTFNAVEGETLTQTFTVTGENLSGDLSLALDDANGVYSITPTTITAAQAANGVPVTVTYNPTVPGSYNGTVTISGGGAAAVNVALTGTASMIKYTPVMLPANEQYINLTKFRADWTDGTPVANVASYTLEVSPKAPEPVEPVLLHSLSGSSYTGSYADITLPAPWGGVSVRGGNGAIYTKNNYNGVATGYITYTIPEGYTNATFTLLIKSGTGNYGAGNFTVGSTQTAAVGHTFTGGETYTWQVVGSTGEQITVYSTDANYSPDIALIAVYSGIYTPAKLMANETGDATYRLIEGITDKFYTVENLTAEGTFLYRVKALYVDGTESDWSNIEEVTLFENGHGYQPGDVNHDGLINLTDITLLISAVVNEDTSEICTICADFNGDGAINLTDVTTLISNVINQAKFTAARPMAETER